MNKKFIKYMILVDFLIGLVVVLLNFETSPTSIYNFIIFLLLVYFYNKNGNQMYVPYFIFQFFVFSLILLNRLFPQFLNSDDPFTNNSMIIISIVAVVFMLSVSFGIWKKKKG